MVTFYDTHAHLDYPDYASDLVEVLKRSEAAGITRVISIGTDLESSRRAIALSERFEMVYAAVGWHPTNVLQAPSDLRPELRELASHPKVVAIGEIGLDYHHLPVEKAGGDPSENETYILRQAEIFAQQMEVAAEFGLNCVIHQRDAMADTLSQLQPFAAQLRGVFHCFVDDAAAMRRVLDLNSIVSFTGILTFKNAQTVRDTLAATPLGKFMLETDSPYLAPIPYRGKRCEPAYVRDIATVAAQNRNVSLEELSAATCATAREFFPKMK